MKEELVSVYVSEDGKRFFSKEACEKYEKDCKEILSHMEFFEILDNPDLTETGNMQRRRYVAVYENNYVGHGLVMQMAFLENKGRCVGPGVMGTGLRETFEIYSSNKVRFIAAEDISGRGTADRIIISAKELEIFSIFDTYTWTPTESITNRSIKIVKEEDDIDLPF